MPEQTLHYLYIYIATEEGDPAALTLGDTSIRDLIEEQNELLRRESTRRRHVLQFETVIDDDFKLPALRTLSWYQECDFRKTPIAFCIIDGRCFQRFVPEVFTIRAHKFPPYEDYPAFCITSPSEALATNSDLPDDREAVRALLETEFNSVLFPPTREGFSSVVRAVRALWQTNEKTIEAVFGRRE